MQLPLFVCKAGFPSPAQDMEEKSIDITQLLVPHPLTTFIAQVEGASMRELGIFSQDYLVIDRSLPVQSGDVVVVRIGNSLLVKQYIKRRNQIVFTSADKKQQLIPAMEDWEIWGKVALRFGKPYAV